MDDGALEDERDLASLLGVADALLVGTALREPGAELGAGAKLDVAPGAELTAGAAAPKVARRTAQMTALENLREAIAMQIEEAGLSAADLDSRMDTFLYLSCTQVYRVRGLSDMYGPKEAEWTSLVAPQANT